MNISARSVLLLAGVALVVAKLAGLISWPWFAIALPLVVWAFPLLFMVTMIVGTAAVGAFMFILIMIGEAIEDFQRKRRRKRDEAKRTA